MGRSPSRGRPWGPGDLAGGPIDEVFGQVRALVPDLVIERLTVTHPGDDDNVYFLGDDQGLDRVQVDTGLSGLPPFLIETLFAADGVLMTSDVAEAVEVVVARLVSGHVGPGDDLA